MKATVRLKLALLGALALLHGAKALGAMVIPPVTFDLDTVGSQSGNPNLVHSTFIDWTVASDPILDSIPAENVYQSTRDQTNLKVEFPTVTLAPGESLRVKVDYRYLSAPSDPGIQQYNFLRFGAYDTHGTSTFTDDQGYLADVSYWESASTSGSTTKSGDYSIRREDNVWDDFDMGPLLDNDTSPVNWTPPPVPETGDIRTMQQPDGSMATFYKGADEGTTDHAAVICITNNGTEVEVCLFHGHPATMVGRAVDRSASPIVTFNAIYLESPSDNNGFNIDNIGIQHLPQGMGCCGDCFEFEDLTLGDTYVVGDTFTTQNMSGTATLDVEAIPFVWASGTVYTGGTARVENGGLAGHGGNELNFNNIGLRFSSASGSVPGFSMLFGEYGGNLNFSINGDFRNFANFQDINGSVIGGAMVFVIGGNGNDQGQLLALGTVSEFTVGGQELYIDHICPETGDEDQPDDPDDPDQPNDGPNDELGSIRGHKFKGGFDSPAGPLGLPGWVIYLDQNRNGVLDGGESSTVTDAMGRYEFLGLAPGNYYVAEQMQSGWVQVVPGAPDFDYFVPLGPGDHVIHVDFVNIPEVQDDCLEWYRANDPGAVMVSGTLSEVKAADFDAAISLMVGDHGLIDFEAYSVGNFATKVLDANVTASLPNTGDAVTGNQPGIADSTTSSSGLGYNTTAGGDQHLQVLPLNNGPDGGVVLDFARPATALGFYLIGLELGKREVWAFIEFADGSNQAVLTDAGLNPGGGLEFFGFIAEDCPVTRFSLIELYDGEPAGDRDIFGVDDIRYVVAGAAPTTTPETVVAEIHEPFEGNKEGDKGHRPEPVGGFGPVNPGFEPQHPEFPQPNGGNHHEPPFGHHEPPFGHQEPLNSNHGPVESGYTGLEFRGGPGDGPHHPERKPLGPPRP